MDRQVSLIVRKTAVTQQNVFSYKNIYGGFSGNKRKACVVLRTCHRVHRIRRVDGTKETEELEHQQDVFHISNSRMRSPLSRIPAFSAGIRFGNPHQKKISLLD
jgi:hypothetical protein